MDRSIGKPTSSSDRSSTLLAFTQSLLGRIKRVLVFFVMSEVELIQAGIDWGHSYQSDTEDQKNPSSELNEQGTIL